MRRALIAVAVGLQAAAGIGWQASLWAYDPGSPGMRGGGSPAAGQGTGVELSIGAHKSIVLPPGMKALDWTRTAVESGGRFVRGGLASFEGRSFHIHETVLPPGRYTIHMLVQADGRSVFCFLQAEQAYQLGGAVPVGQIIEIEPAQGRLLSSESLTRADSSKAPAAKRPAPSKAREEAILRAKASNRIQYAHRNAVPSNGGGAGQPAQTTGSYAQAIKQAKAVGSDEELNFFPVPALKVSRNEKGFAISFVSPEGYLTADLPFAE